ALLLFAGALQVLIGRTDLQRGHRVLSTAFWTPALSILAAVALFGWWAVNPSIGDLVRSDDVSPAPAGSWVATTGRVWRGAYLSTFLVDAASGRSPPVGPHPVAFSADRPRAAWLATAGAFFDDPELRPHPVALAAARPEATSVATTIEPGLACCASLVFSPEKRHLLVVGRASLRLVALDTGQSVADVAAPPGLAFDSAAFD